MNKFWTAPLNGYYRVSSSLMIAIPTNRFEWRKNYNKKWWQFWKPKQILERVNEYKNIDLISKTVKLNTGETFHMHITGIDRIANV